MKRHSTLTINFLLLTILLLSFCVQRTKAEGNNNTVNSTEAGEDRASKCIAILRIILKCCFELLYIDWTTVLSLFSIVRFANTACTGTNSYNGTCYTSAECSSYGGTGSGTCAAGFGVCCIGMFSHDSFNFQWLFIRH